MGTVEYRDALRAVLDPMSQSTTVRLSALHRAATVGADGMLIEVFVDQDAEGPFGVWARFEGADSLSLDRQLGDERELFSVIWGEKGWEPPVPARPAAWSREQLEDAVVDVVAERIDPLIPRGTPDLRWEVVTPDGATDPIRVGLNDD
ncbi:MAG: hypothetical protein JF592_10605 [Microbacterium sp.]|uniref:DUF6389 family protein n=1 Tax=Microbacterium sp. TaxID=51671 RepID=UPI001D2404B2|nr:DUF6389 family protein [Microbacterium sp.]MBW8763022.1 hypothetical protein [Microbacterium sp.]